MKQALLSFLLVCSPLLADSILSFQGSLGGIPACSDTGPTAAHCSVQSGTANDGTAVYTSGALNLEGSGLQYTLTGSLDAGQGILSRANPMAAFSATLTMPDTSGNWIISGYATSSESSRYALNVLANGSPAGYIGNGSSSFLVQHPSGAPLTFSVADNVEAIFSNDNEALNFTLTFTDPPAGTLASTPEPPSLALIASAIGCLLAYKHVCYLVRSTL